VKVESIKESIKVERNSVAKANQKLNFLEFLKEYNRRQHSLKGELKK
jgi:hypothetical protein